jgi:hypothetical protein
VATPRGASHHDLVGASEGLSQRDLGGGKGKTPEWPLQHPHAGVANTSTVPRFSSSSQRIINAGQRETSGAGAPPLLLNEKTAAQAAETVDPKIIKRGQRKVWTQKQLITIFDFSAK